MKAAVVRSAGEVPVYADFEAPQLGASQYRVTVRASALSNLARARASGKHYSAGGTFPFIAGVDGVGTLDDGQRVYFALPRAPYGAMAEQVPLHDGQFVPVPDDIDDVTAAALCNPGMSSWMALRERADFQPGETVLINGATGASGLLAIQIARYMGAGRIVATGRNPEVLQRLQGVGADQVISLRAEEEELKAAFESAFKAGVDVVLDYLWGPSARMILSATSRISDPARALRFVQIGSIAGEEIPLPAAILRSRANILMGSGLGSVSPARMMASIGDLLASAGKAGFSVATETAPLSQVSESWNRDTGRNRLVFTI